MSWVLVQGQREAGCAHVAPGSGLQHGKQGICPTGSFAMLKVKSRQRQGPACSVMFLFPPQMALTPEMCPSSHRLHVLPGWHLMLVPSACMPAAHVALLPFQQRLDSPGRCCTVQQT